MTPNRYGHYRSRPGTSQQAPAADAGYRARVARRAAAASVKPGTIGLPTGPAAAADQGFTFNAAGAGGFPGASLVAPDGSYAYAIENASAYGQPGDDSNPLNVGNFFGNNAFDPFTPPTLSGDASGSFGTPTPQTTVAGDVPAAAPWHYRRALKNYGPGGTAPVAPAAGGVLGADPATTGIRYRAKRIVTGWAGFSQTKKILVIAGGSLAALAAVAYRRVILAKLKSGGR